MMLLLVLTITAQFEISVSVQPPKLKNVEGKIGFLETGEIDNSTEYYFRFLMNSDSDVYVVETEVGSATPAEYPVTFEVRQPQFPLFWQLPKKVFAGVNAYAANRTICINITGMLHTDNNKLSNVTIERVTVAVFTSNPSSVNFSILVREAKCQLHINEVKQVSVSVTSPVLLRFYYPPEELFSTSVLKVSLLSSSSRCMTVSVQEPQCPVRYMDENTKRFGFYHMMARKDTLTMQRELHKNGFFLVLILNLDDEKCNQDVNSSSIQNGDAFSVKDVQIHIRESIGETQFILGMLIPLFVCMITVSVSLWVLVYYKPDHVENYIETRDDREIVSCVMDEEICVQSVNLDETGPNRFHPNDQGPEDSVSISTGVYENAKQTLRRLSVRVKPKRVVTLNDILDPAESAHMEKISMKHFTYSFIVLSIAVYYALPVIAYLKLYLLRYEKSGNHDICYYNNDCAYPSPTITVFGLIINDVFHVYSNFGYCVAGILSLIYSFVLHKRHRAINPVGLGISPNFHISFAISEAIFWEGLLSASYHICPNRPNFHIDTFCMYVLAALFAVKLFQARHPDINHSSLILFMVVIMILDWTGEKDDGEEFNCIHFSIFSIIHLTVLILFAKQLIYLGRPRFITVTVPQEIWEAIRNWGGSNTVQIDGRERLLAGKDTFLFLLAAMICNLILMILQASWWHLHVGLYLLYILCGNTFLYFTHYVIMKIVHGERFHVLAVVNLAIAMVAGIFGVIMFKDIKSKWERSPSDSKVLNEDCDLFVYDTHDVWHFSSALALFTTINMLNYIDVDLWTKSRENIAVF